MALWTLDVLAEICAVTATRVPGIERWAIAAARSAGTSPLAAGFRRRFFPLLATRLAAEGRAIRPIEVCGRRVLLDVSRPFAFPAHFDGRLYEAHASRIVASLGPPDVFVDVGANEGYFALLAALAIGGAGRVHAFEPHPEARAQMEAALDRNGVRGRVAIHAVALSRTSGVASLFLSDRGPGFSSLQPTHAPAAPGSFTASIEVPTTTIDQWATIADLRPTLIKIDVEGAELLVLEGASDTIRRATTLRIICETTAGSAADRFLTDRGFRSEGLSGDEGNRMYVRAAVTEGVEPAC